MTQFKYKISLVIFGFAMFISLPAFASEDDDAIAACLKSWGKHPFGANPQFKVVSAPIKLFGMGDDPVDNEVTDTPSLVLVSPSVNVMGMTKFSLLNPNGWYCFKGNVNVAGKMSITAHCDAHIGSATEGATVGGMNSGSKGITVMGMTELERVDCK